MAKRKDSRSAADNTATLKDTAAAPEVTIMAPSDPVTLSDAPTLAPTAAEMIGPRKPVDPIKAPASAEKAPAVETLTKIAAEIASAPKMPAGPNMPMPPSTPKASGAEASAPSSSRPFLRIAATVALAAGIGALLGAGGVSAYGRLTAAPAAAVVHTVEANPSKTAKLEADIAALKASLEATAKNTNSQFGKLADRLERAEKAQAEPAAKLAKLSDKINDALERFDQRLAAASAPETTGSVPATRSAAVAPAEPKLQDKLHTTPPQPVIAGWVLRDIFDGRALVESRYGMYEVGPGGNLPGLGRVATIKRQDGRWVVVTPKGVIVSER